MKARTLTIAGVAVVAAGLGWYWWSRRTQGAAPGSSPDGSVSFTSYQFAAGQCFEVKHGYDGSFTSTPTDKGKCCSDVPDQPDCQ